MRVGHFPVPPMWAWPDMPQGVMGGVKEVLPGFPPALGTTFFL